MMSSLFTPTPPPPAPMGPSQPRGRWKKPLLAVLLTLLADGLGQVYNGELFRGLAFAFASWALLLLGFSYLMSFFVGLILFIILSLSYKIYLCTNAFLVARRFQSDPTPVKAPLPLKIGTAVLIIVVFFFLSSDFFVKDYLTFHAFKVPSGSMCPTICEGDRFIANMRAFRQKSPQRGDVVLFLFETERTLHIKRVAAVPGDEVSQSRGHLMVNGSPLALPSHACGTPAVQPSDQETSSELAPQRVPPDKLFLVGDNWDNSYDSRHYGAVEVSRVRGRPVYLYWSGQRTRIGCAIK